MRLFRWIVIILSWMFILSSCSQEECELDLPEKYSYRVDMFSCDSFYNRYHVDTRFCDSYYTWKDDSMYHFVYKECYNGRKRGVEYQWIGKNCLITKLL